MGSHEELLFRGEGYASLIQLHKAHGDEHQAPGVDDSNLRLRSSDVVVGQLSGRALDEVFSNNGIAVQPLAKPRQLERPKASGANSMNLDVVEVKPKKPSVPSLRRLIALNKPEWKQGLLGVAGAIGFGFVQPIYAYTIGNLLGSFYSKDSVALRHDVKINSAVLASLSVFALAVNIIQHYNFAALGEHLTKRIRVRMLTNILRLEVGWYDQDENASGALCSRLATDASTVRSQPLTIVKLH